MTNLTVPRRVIGASSVYSAFVRPQRWNYVITWKLFHFCNFVAFNVYKLFYVFDWRYYCSCSCLSCKNIMLFQTYVWIFSFVSKVENIKTNTNNSKWIENKTIKTNFITFWLQQIKKWQKCNKMQKDGWTAKWIHCENRISITLHQAQLKKPKETFLFMTQENKTFA